jgi:asparagine synthase (glutamine-hydrolysing)
MAGIAGCTRPGARSDVAGMLQKMAHRGPAGRAVYETDAGTLGVAWTGLQASAKDVLECGGTAQDAAGATRLARAGVKDGRLTLTRDSLGIAPLYYARDGDGEFWFASEVKALLGVARDVQIMPAGYHYDGVRLTAYAGLVPQPVLWAEPTAIAAELRDRLAVAVHACVHDSVIGCWLSGGLDSSAVAALARGEVKTLHTFAAGLAGAPDLEQARAAAEFIRTEHHEVRVAPAEMLAVLPAVIYHLESFDALLVRSSIVNYLAGRVAARYVPVVLSGEGADELFAGYAYLKQLPPARLADELFDLTRRLHNTALQRVDRCAAAHGLVARVPFLAPTVVDYALRIPVDLKLRGGMEKWILREAVADLLPPAIRQRRKAKFWEGAGVGDLLARHADDAVSDADFGRERRLENGVTIRTKEEMMYYRIFREQFGDFASLDWMGRTKGAPEV